MTDKVQIIAIAGSIVLLLIIFEAIRKRHLREQYALLWLLTGAVLLLLSVWRDLLHLLSTFVGVYYPPSLLLLIFIGLVVLILLSFSVAVSELSAKVTKLTQTLALLESERQRRSEEASKGKTNHDEDEAVHAGTQLPGGT